MLSSQQLLSGSVMSVEDHGYLIDIGVTGTHAFLPNQKAKTYIKALKKGKKYCRRIWWVKMEMENDRD